MHSSGGSGLTKKEKMSQQLDETAGSVVNDPKVDQIPEEFAFDMSMKKKKKKKVVEATGAEGEQSGALGEDGEPSMKGGEASADGTIVHPGAEGEPWRNCDRDYTYEELVNRVFSILRQNNPDLAGEKRKFTIVPPQIGREGSKKTAFANITDLCRRMRRPLEHVTSFILTELGTTGSSDGAQRLIIRGRYQQLQIENVLRKYIGEYVTCKTCRSPDTVMNKENRLFFLKCESCGSTRSVTAIKSGFKAQTTKRSAARTG